MLFLIMQILSNITTSLWLEIQGTFPPIWSVLVSIIQNRGEFCGACRCSDRESRLRWEGDDRTIPSQRGRWLYCCRWISHPPLMVAHTLMWPWVYAEESRCSACFFCSRINSRYPPFSQPLSDQRQTRLTRNTQLSQGLCWFLHSTPAPQHKNWLSSLLMVSII